MSVPSSPNTAVHFFFTIELCIHGPILVHIHRRGGKGGGGDIDGVVYID